MKDTNNIKPHIKDFFNFLEDKGEKKTPLKIKLSNPDDFKINPEDLNVEGDFDLRPSKIRQLLSVSKITQLPDNLKVGGNIYLNQATMEQLPNNLQVGGNLDLSVTSIKKLPDGLKVGGELNLTDSPIEQLSDGLQVGGDLYLFSTPIKQFPNNLQVGGDLWLVDTPMSRTMSRKQIRQEIEQKGGYVKGEIFLKE